MKGPAGREPGADIIFLIILYLYYIIYTFLDIYIYVFVCIVLRYILVERTDTVVLLTVCILADVGKGKGR